MDRQRRVERQPKKHTDKIIPDASWLSGEGLQPPCASLRSIYKSLSTSKRRCGKNRSQAPSLRLQVQLTSATFSSLEACHARSDDVVLHRGFLWIGVSLRQSMLEVEVALWISLL